MVYVEETRTLIKRILPEIRDCQTYYLEKTRDYYHISDFYKDFTNFQLEENDFTRLIDTNPWNINIRTDGFQKYSPYTLFIVMKALPIVSLIFYQYLFLRKQEV